MHAPDMPECRARPRQDEGGCWETHTAHTAHTKEESWPSAVIKTKEGAERTCRGAEGEERRVRPCRRPLWPDRKRCLAQVCACGCNLDEVTIH